GLHQRNGCDTAALGLGHEPQLRQPETRAAVLGGERDAEDLGGAELLPELGVEAEWFGGPDTIRRALPVEEPGEQVLDSLLLVGGCELHRVKPLFFGVAIRSRTARRIAGGGTGC